MPTTHPVTTAFLSQCSAVTASANGDGSVIPTLFPGVTLWPRVSESGAWSFGLSSGNTMAPSVLVELQGARRANTDGSYVILDGYGAEVPRVLTLTSAGACEPGNPPPPRLPV